MAILNQILKPKFQAPPGVGIIQPNLPTVPVDPAQLMQQGGGATAPTALAPAGAGMFNRTGGIWDQIESALGTDLNALTRRDARGVLQDNRDVVRDIRKGVVSPAPAGGVPGAGGGAPSPNPYGGGMMGSIMKAFNMGGQGGLDPAKLMSMIGVGM